MVLGWTGGPDAKGRAGCNKFFHLHLSEEENRQGTCFNRGQTQRTTSRCQR